MQDLSTSESTANPAPLGLMGFGMTTVLLNFHNAGLFGLGSMILSMGIFYGGAAQVIAGIMEWKKGNTFAATAFTSYGFFWFSLVGLKEMPAMGIAAEPELGAMVAYLIMWGIFTGVLFIGTLRLNRALQIVFGSLTLLFFLLALSDITGNALIGTITGIEGILCGFSAIYAGLAQVLNEVYGKTVWPIGPVRSEEKRISA
ncbi:MAG: acetate uptake transporter [Sphaerochaetaceae bacterium]|nr:acetate uptake transporter [Sphaerochaetaceae bacterium]